MSFTWRPFCFIMGLMKNVIKVFILSVMAALLVGCGEVNQGRESDSIVVESSEHQIEHPSAPKMTITPMPGESPCPPVAQTARPVEIPSVKVAVIDTGFSPLCIPAESILEGKNYLYPERSCDDTYGHGTAVASIILRYAPEALLVPLVSNAYEDGKITRVDNTTLARMIRDAVDVYDCDIINISAGLVLDKDVVREAVDYAEEKDVLVVASVGNDYELNGSLPYYPAAYDTVLAVGALNEEGTAIADFSQRGEWVDVYCIGENVTIGTLSGNTRTSDGTSYSAAKITALAVKIMQEWQQDGAGSSAENAALDVEMLREEILSLAEIWEDGTLVIFE